LQSPNGAVLAFLRGSLLGPPRWGSRWNVRNETPGDAWGYRRAAPLGRGTELHPPFGRVGPLRAGEGYALDPMLSPPLASLDPPKGRVMRNALQNNNLKSAPPPARAGFAGCYENGISKLHGLFAQSCEAGTKHSRLFLDFEASLQRFDLHLDRFEL
jgi:hypothetical protein